MLNLSKIQLELERAKEKLRNVEETIQKVEGKTFSNGPVRYGGLKSDYHSDKTRNSGTLEDSKNVRRRVIASAVDLRIQRLSGDEPSFGLKRGLREKREAGLGFKRQGGDIRPQGVFARLSGPPYHQPDEEDEDDLGKKPTLPSRVYTTATEVPSRQEVIAAQAQDQQSKERNKRMFGALVGTLQKFRKEETRVREREEKRMKVEKKLEEDAKREKEKLMQEKRELFLEKKRREVEIKRIEWSLNRVKEYEAWEADVLPLKNFIQTQAKPHIFYLPNVHNAKTEERLAHSQKLVERMIEKRKTNLKEEIENSEKKARKAAVEDAEEEEAENIPEDNEENCNAEQQMQVDIEPKNKENGYFEEDKKDQIESLKHLDQNEVAEDGETWNKAEEPENKEPPELIENEKINSDNEENKEKLTFNDNKDLLDDDLNGFNEKRLSDKVGKEPLNDSEEGVKLPEMEEEEGKTEPSGTNLEKPEVSEEIDNSEVLSKETETPEAVTEKVPDSEVTSTDLINPENNLESNLEETTNTEQSLSKSEPKTEDSIKIKSKSHEEKKQLLETSVRRDKSPSKKSSRRSKSPKRSRSPRDSGRSKRRSSDSRQRRVSRRGSFSNSPPRRSRRSRSPIPKRRPRNFSSRKRSPKAKRRGSSRSSSSVSPRKEKSRSSSSISKSD